MEFGIELFFEGMSVWVCSSRAMNQYFPHGTVKATAIADGVLSLMKWGLFQRYQWEVNILMCDFERKIADVGAEKHTNAVVCSNNVRCWYHLLDGHVAISLVDILMRLVFVFFVICHWVP